MSIVALCSGHPKYWILEMAGEDPGQCEDWALAEDSTPWDFLVYSERVLEP